MNYRDNSYAPVRFAALTLMGATPGQFAEMTEPPVGLGHIKALVAWACLDDEGNLHSETIRLLDVPSGENPFGHDSERLIFELKDLSEQLHGEIDWALDQSDEGTRIRFTTMRLPTVQLFFGPEWTWRLRARIIARIQALEPVIEQ